jgi:hypothetical protein
MAGGPPSRSRTRSSTQRSSRAIRLSAVYGTPPSRTGVVSPSRALNSRIVRSLDVAARCSAESPTRTVPSGFTTMTEGTNSSWSPSDTISGSRPRRIAAAV